MSRILTFKDDVQEARVHPGPITIVNLSTTDRLWIDDHDGVGTGEGLPVEPSGVTSFVPHGGHIYYCRDSNHAGAADPTAVLAHGAGSYNNPAAARALAPNGSTYLGNVDSSTATYQVTGYSSLCLYLVNGGSVGGTITVTFNNDTSGAGGSLYLLGTPAHGSQGPQGAWYWVPIPAGCSSVYVRSSALTSQCFVWANVQFIDTLKVIPAGNQKGGATAETEVKPPGATATALSIASVAGPCWMEYRAQVTDPTVNGYFGFGMERNYTTISIEGPGFLDTAQMVNTNTPRGRVASGRVLTNPGLDSVVWVQDNNSVAGSLVRFAFTLHPVN